MPSRRRWIADLCALAAASTLAPRWALGRTPANVAYDPLWTLDTRTAGCDLDRAQAFHAADCGQPWNRTSAAETFAALSREAATPDTFVLVYLHGNRATLQTGIDAGLMVHRAMRPFLQPHERLPLLIWCWPSDQVKGTLRDVRTKAAVTEGQYGLFADTLGRLPPEARVGIVGYSYGARIALGGLNEIGRRRESTGFAAPKPRLALWATAMNAVWMAPGGRFRCAYDALDRLLLVRNTCDPALQYYHAVEGNRNVRALGYVGLEWGCPAPDKCRQIDGSGRLGNDHDMANYLKAPDILRESAHEVLWRVNSTTVDSH